jgi:Ca2+-binding EF-hand superfamily protein
MKLRGLAFVLLAFFTAGAGAQQSSRPSPEEAFKGLDTDGNGKLSRTEFSKLKDYVPYFRDRPEAIDSTFDRLDKNHHGELTLEEYREFYHLGASAQQERPRVSPEEAFAALDTDGNGTLNLEEFSQLKNYVPFFQAHPEAVEATFKKLDVKSDGQLTIEEYRELYNLRRRAQEGNSPPTPSAAPKPEPVKPEVPKTGASKVEQPTPEGLAFFEKKIRPVLVDKCYKCHSADSEKIKGGLVLDTRQGIRLGGDTGPAVVPGDVSGSLLVEALRYTNKDLKMPPEKSGGKLPDDVIADFEQWIKMGAPDSREASHGVAASKPSWDTEKAKNHWAFKAPRTEAPPAVRDSAWPHSDIDRFLLAALEARDLKPVADADKTTLLRRVYFDLTGLPPTPEELAAFLADPSPNAFAKVVDALLASPRFGETWGRHWLDVARYAESTGRDVNATVPHAWRYRDYVIAAFNADQPYDQFIREQIAGDLLPAKDDRERAQNLIATGFLAIGSINLTERNPRQFALDLADEQLDTVSQAVLGMTVACARCHDHKFDPIPQRDYYAMAGIFLSTETCYGTAPLFENGHPGKEIPLPVGAGLPVPAKKINAEKRAALEAAYTTARSYSDGMFSGKIPQPKEELKKRLAALVLADRVGQTKKELESYDADGNLKPLAVGVSDLPAGKPSRSPGVPHSYEEVIARFQARAEMFSAVGDSPLFVRGDAAKPADKVPRGFLTALGAAQSAQIAPGQSGRRELADWLVSSKNPLTARVYVNRVWHSLFGRGLVESVNNFGTTGDQPSNPALLDYLAVRFQQEGWSTKKLIREIVLSHGYQLSSGYDDRNFTSDPENALVWRHAPHRLEAEAIRDSMLAVSGALQLVPPVGSEVALIGDGALGGREIRFMRKPLNGDLFVEAKGEFRSVYLPVVRNALPDALAAFDFAEPNNVGGHREATNVPTQALYLLNNDFVTAQARHFADRLLALPPPERVNRAFQLAFSRLPTPNEEAATAALFQGYPTHDEKAAWTSFCRALFGCAEFRILD